MGQRVVHVQAADLRELLVPHRVLLGKQETKELDEDKGMIRPYILTTSHNKKPTTKISASLVTSNPPNILPKTASSTQLSQNTYI